MWLIALAVPIQGSAAVTMFGCDPGHHDGLGFAQMTMADEHAQDTDHESGGGVTSRDELQHHDGAAPHDHLTSVKTHGTAHKEAKANCTPCASCCVAAALPATVIQFEAVPHVDFFVPVVHSGVSSFLADGLERPPRFLLV